MTAEHTFEISADFKGKNKRIVTLAQFRAELDARKALAGRVIDAVRRGDIKACGEAQAAMRAQVAS